MKFKKAFIVFIILFFFVFAALLELSKNTLLGWALFIILTVAFIVLHGKYINKKKWYLRICSWLVFFIAVGVIFKVSAPPEKLIPAVDYKNPEVTSEITVEQGKLTGVYTEDKKAEVYAGIPYAKPPVGELRWKEPQAPDKWDGVRACDTFGPMSIQSNGPEIINTMTALVGYHQFKISLKDNYVGKMSEDSLYLNVWKPSGDVKDLPVLFFIHGGSLTTGQTWSDTYNGEALAKQGIIVVNCAYRLNVFGYYANEDLIKESNNNTTGNYGLLDQIAALKWVNENIDKFGGDKDNITIAGESAGSSSVNAICVSPLAKGLFKRAIAESSSITPHTPYHTFRTLENALKMGEDIKEEFGASSIEDLRNVPADKLVKTSYTNSSMTVDGYAITEQPYLTYEKGNNNEESLMNGFNVHEADYFMFTNKVTKDNYVDTIKRVLGDYAEDAAKLVPPYEQDPRYKLAIVEMGGDAKGAANRIYSAAWFQYSHNDWSRYIADQDKDVYEYYFTKGNNSLGNSHGGEMPYCYGNLHWHDNLYDKSDYELSEMMQQYWLNYIKTGNPNGKGLPKWQKFNDDQTLVMELGDNVGMITDPNLELYALFDKYQGR